MNQGSIDLCEALGNRVLILKAVSNWAEAVRLAGNLLSKNGIVDDKYTDAMIRVTKELGPYSVVAPGIAIPHARPEDGAHKVGISILIVKNGVNFGSPNDPVYIVIGFAATDKTSHLGVLKELAEFLSNEDLMEKMKKSLNELDVLRIFKEYCSSRELKITSLF